MYVSVLLYRGVDYTTPPETQRHLMGQVGELHTARCRAVKIPTKVMHIILISTCSSGLRSKCVLYILD